MQRVSHAAPIETRLASSPRYRDIGQDLTGSTAFQTCWNKVRGAPDAGERH